MSRILVAEDEPRIASFVAKGLSASGLVPEVAGDGASTLALALTGDYDLLVLDIGLPGMDGFEVLRRIRAAGNGIPIIILTARDSASDTIAGLEGGPTTTCPSRSASASSSPASGCGCAPRRPMGPGPSSRVAA